MENRRQWVFCLQFLALLFESSHAAKLSSLHQNCTCGIDNAIAPKILGGKLSEPPHKFPWMAALVDKDEKLIGGGSVIGRQHILTAAHCCAEKRDIKIRIVLGGHKMSSTPLPLAIKKCVTHPEYQGAAYLHDIAIIILEEPIMFHDFVSPVCLPDGDEVKTGDNVTVIGWGRTSEVQQPSDALKIAHLPVVSTETCRKKFGSQILDTQLCAGGQNEDTCQGDSGGPLMFKTSANKWVQVGLVSWGIGCGREGYPGIYTKVSMYFDFINNVTEGKLCNTDDDTRTLEVESAERPLQQPNIENCGIANRYGQQRIVGGSQVFTNKYPWLVPILFQGNLSGAGAYIGNGFVATAASLMGSEATSNLSRLEIKLGSSDLKRKELTSVSYKVSKATLHPQYKYPYYDVALLQLDTKEKPIPDKFRPICLPKSTEVLKPGTKGVIVGWGQVDTSGPYSDTPNEAHVQVVPEEECNKHYDNAITNILLCADAKDRDICNGDGGGPFMHFSSERYYLTAIASSGHTAGCSVSNVPSVYTKMPLVLKWITEVTGLKTA